MATEIAKAYVQIIPSAEGIQGGIASALGDAGIDSAATGAGTRIASLIKGAIGAAAIGTVIKEALNEGAAFEQNIGGIETLYKDSADLMKEYAAQAFETAGLSANAYMETATSFAAGLVNSLGGDTQAAAEAANTAIIDMADNANKMGSSMESIQNAYQGFAKQNYTMLDNLKLGYGGTKTEMERLLADAQAITGVEYNIENLSDVYEAIHVIQGELGITGTTADEATKTFSGSLASMKASLSNFLATMATGGDVTSALSTLVNTATTFLMNNALPMIMNVAQGVVAALPELVNQVIAFLTDPSAINMIIEAGFTLLTSLIGNLPEIITTIIQALPDIIVNIVDALISNIPMLVDAGFQLFVALIANLPQIIVSIVQAIPQIINGIITSLRNAMPQIAEAGFNLIVSLVEKLSEIDAKIKEAIKQLIDNLLGKITGAKDAMVDAGKNLLFGIGEGITNAISSVVAKAKDAAASIVDGIKSFLQIGSPSRLLANEVGQWIPAGIAEGITDNSDLVTDAMNDVTMSGIGSSIEPMMSDVGEIAGAGNITIPVYIGQERLDTIILNAQQRHALVSGGR
jgi:phage-related protein